MLTWRSHRSPLREHFSSQANMATFLLWTIQRADAHGSVCESTTWLHRESTVNLPLEIQGGRLAPAGHDCSSNPTTRPRPVAM